MQALTAALEAILKAKFQAGASGFRGVVEVDTPFPATGEAVEGESMLYAYTAPGTTTIWNVSNADGAIGGTPADWDTPGFDDSGWDAAIDVGDTSYTYSTFNARRGVPTAPSKFICSQWALDNNSIELVWLKIGRAHV